MDDEEIRRLDDEVREAMLGRAVAALSRLCSEDFIVTNPFNRILDRRQVLKAIESGRLRHSAFEREIEYLRAFDGTAVVMGRETVVDDGPTIHRRYTEVWMKRDGTLAAHRATRPSHSDLMTAMPVSRTISMAFDRARDQPFIKKVR